MNFEGAATGGVFVNSTYTAVQFKDELISGRSITLGDGTKYSISNYDTYRDGGNRGTHDSI